MRQGSIVVLPPGSAVVGTVAEVERTRKPRRSIVRLEFSTLLTGGTSLPIQTRVVSVDNAREVVDEDGRIVGAARPVMRPGVVEAALVLAHANPVVAGILEAARWASGRARPVSIDYRSGVDVVLELQAAVSLDTTPLPSASGVLPPELAELARAQPDHVQAGLTRPADLTNLLMVGTEGDLCRAFARAGWSQPDHPSLRTDAKLIWAFAARRPYRAAPVSRLSLEGRPPDLVFEKQTNTITKRHHVRLWRRGETWNGQPVFLAAATHDVGLFFSRAGRRVTHHIEPWIDLEREKIVDDLALAGAVAMEAVVDRPAAPKACRNAAGDPVRTDGGIAVVVLAPPPPAEGPAITTASSGQP